MGRKEDRGTEPILPLLKKWLACNVGEIISPHCHHSCAFPYPVPEWKVGLPWFDLPIAFSLQRTKWRLGAISLFHLHRCEVWSPMQIILQLPLVWAEPGVESCFHSVSSIQVVFKWDGDFPPLFNIYISNLQLTKQHPHQKIHKDSGNLSPPVQWDDCQYSVVNTLLLVK